MSDKIQPLEDAIDAADWGRNVVSTAIAWRNARKAFLRLPASHEDTRKYLNDLSEAEDALYKAVGS